MTTYSEKFIRETEKIPIPLNNIHSLNKSKIETFSKTLPDNSIKHTFNNLIKLTNYITFNNYYSSLVNCVNKFLEYIKIKDTNYIFLISTKESNSLRDRKEGMDILKNKSNYWVSKLVYINLLLYKPISIFFDFDFIEQNRFDGILHILICDDMAYSGNQLIMFIEYLHKRLNDINYNLHIIIPFISSIALEAIKKLDFFDKIHLYYLDEFQSFKNLAREDITKFADFFNLTIPPGHNTYPQIPIYFDHKLADWFSSFPEIYIKLINNCDDYNNSNSARFATSPPCPEPPYKKTTSANKFIMANKEYLDEIISTGGCKKIKSKKSRKSKKHRKSGKSRKSKKHRKSGKSLNRRKFSKKR